MRSNTRVRRDLIFALCRGVAAALLNNPSRLALFCKIIIYINIYIYILIKVFHDYKNYQPNYLHENDKGNLYMSIAIILKND